MPLVSFIRWLVGKLGYVDKLRMDETRKLDVHKLDQILQKYTSELPNSLQGVTFSVFNQLGDTLYSGGYGTRTLDPNSEALSTETPLWAASITKLVTSLACMIAVEQGLIGLDDNVREIVPELKDTKLLVGFEDSDTKPRKPILNDVDEPISLRQLLSHTSGFSYDVFEPDLMEWSQSIGRTAHSFCGSFDGYTHPLIHKPGRGWAYGPGMDWAGRVVEILSKQSLEEFMQKNIFSKLDMHETTFRPELIDGYLPRKMESATRDPKTGGLLAGAGRHPLPIPVQDSLGGLGLYSTPKDLVKVLKEVLAGGGTIVKRESVTEMLKGQLNEETRAAFMQVIDGRSKSHLRQTWPNGYEGTFGLSSSINFDDFPGRRSKDSVNWAGASGLQAWIDPSFGIGGLLTTQLVPPGDRMFTQCLLDLETEVYSALREQK